MSNNSKTGQKDLLVYDLNLKICILITTTIRNPF